MMKSPTNTDKVQEFMNFMGQIPDPDLYQELIFEEFEEWDMGGTLNKEAELKELADLVYVIYGYAISKGYDLDTAFNRVHRNNIDRCFWPDGSIKRDERGKILKNPKHPKVQLGDLT